MMARGHSISILGTLLGILLIPATAFRSGLNIVSGGEFPTPCPRTCFDAGPDHTGWDVYASLAELRQCQQSVVFDFAIYNPPTVNPQHIRACSVWGGQLFNEAPSPIQVSRRAANISNKTTVPSDVELAWWGDSPVSDSEDSGAANAASGLRNAGQYLRAVSRQGKKTIFLVSAGKSVVGVYVGQRISNVDVADRLIPHLVGHILPRGLQDAAAVQLCGAGRAAEETLGIMASTDITKVQSALQNWTSGSCAQEQTGSSTLEGVELDILQPRTSAFRSSNSSESSPMRRYNRRPRQISKRDQCTTITVVQGDLCGTLAAKCGISDADFLKWNPKPDLCPNLVIDQEVCCSPGDLPNRRKQKNSDGSCATYDTVPDDNCSGISIRHGLTLDELERFNENTWGKFQCAAFPVSLVDFVSLLTLLTLLTLLFKAGMAAKDSGLVSGSV